MPFSRGRTTAYRDSLPVFRESIFEHLLRVNFPSGNIWVYINMSGSSMSVGTQNSDGSFNQPTTPTSPTLNVRTANGATLLEGPTRTSSSSESKTEYIINFVQESDYLTFDISGGSCVLSIPNKIGFANFQALLDFYGGWSSLFSALATGNQVPFDGIQLRGPVMLYPSTGSPGISWTAVGTASPSSYLTTAEAAYWISVLNPQSIAACSDGAGIHYSYVDPPGMVSHTFISHWSKTASAGFEAWYKVRSAKDVVQLIASCSGGSGTAFVFATDATGRKYIKPGTDLATVQTYGYDVSLSFSDPGHDLRFWTINKQPLSSNVHVA